MARPEPVSLAAKDIHLSFGTNPVLRGVDLDVPAGTTTAIIGPSGSGKSTLLRCIAGLEEISSGTLNIGGKRMNDVDPAQRGLAMVFQSYGLYPHMSVGENIGYPLKLRGIKGAEREARVRAANDKAKELGNRQPVQLKKLNRLKTLRKQRLIVRQ